MLSKGVKTQEVRAAEWVWRSHDQDAASTYVLHPHMGTRVSWYFGESERGGVRNEVRSRQGNLDWEQRDCRGYDSGF